MFVGFGLVCWFMVGVGNFGLLFALVVLDLFVLSLSVCLFWLFICCLGCGFWWFGFCSLFGVDYCASVWCFCLVLYI